MKKEVGFRDGSPPRFIENLGFDYFTYSEKSVRCMSPLRASVSCMAKAAVRQWRVWPPVPSFR